MRWQRLHRDRARATNRKWLANHPDKFKEYWKKYYPLNRDAVIAKGRAWRKRHHERNLEGIRRWSEQNPDKVKEYARKRNLRIKAGGPGPTDAEVLELFNRCGNRCLCCGKSESELSHPLQLDHVVPVVLGGVNAIENRQILCKKCNSAKSRKVIDYRQERKEVSR